MTIRHSLARAQRADPPAAAFAQWNGSGRAPGRAPPLRRVPRSRALDGAARARAGTQPWRTPSRQVEHVARRSSCIDLPPAIEQGVDMIYIDQELVRAPSRIAAQMHDISFDAWSGAPVDLFVSVNPIYTDLRRGLVKYRQQWGDLPGPDSRRPGAQAGSTGERVSLLRQRLGLGAGRKLRCCSRRKREGIPGRPRDQGRRYCRCRDNRGAEPRPAFTSSSSRSTWSGRSACPAPQEQRKFAVVDFGRRPPVALGERPQGRRDEGRGREGRDGDSDDGGLHPSCQCRSLLERAARAGPGLIGPRVAAQGVSYLTDREYQVLTDCGDARRSSIRIRSTGRGWSMAASRGACAVSRVRRTRWA